MFHLGLNPVLEKKDAVEVFIGSVNKIGIWTVNEIKVLINI